MIKRIDVTAFVDWQSQISNAGQQSEQRADRKSERTITYISDAIGVALAGTRAADLFRVAIRLYHGWYRGLTATPHRRAVETLLNDRLVPRAVGNVSFDWSKAFGDTLYDAFEHRRHPRLKIHLPDTLRDDLDFPGQLRQKMVDTAIVCDVLFSTRVAPEDWRLILAEDDDLVPVVFVAEKWGKEKGGRTMLLRSRSGFGHLLLDGLVWPLRGNS